MSAILRSLRLIQEFEIELESSRKKFIQNLKNNVDDEEIKFWTSILDVFSQGYSKYKGKVGHKKFVLKKRSRLFDIGKNIAVVTGKYKENGRSLILAIEINAFQTGMKIFYGFLSLFYLIFIANLVGSIISGSTDELPFIIIMTILQMTFFFGVPYLIMRRSIRYLKSEIIRDFTALSQ